MTRCPACDHDSSCSWRCEYCGRDLVDVDDDDDPDAAPLVTDGGTDHGRGSGGMQQVCARLPDEQIEGIDDAVDAGEFPNRSEAIRAAIREWLDDDESADPRSHLRPDGGHVAPGPSATSRDPRRVERDSVRSYEHGGIADQGQCPHVDPGEPPCAECFLDGGDE